MTADERRELAHALAAIDLPHPLLDPRLRLRMRFALLFTMGCCIVLAGWIAILILTLPGHYTSDDWRTVWVGLDLAELAGFAAFVVLGGLLTLLVFIGEAVRDAFDPRKTPRLGSPK